MSSDNIRVEGLQKLTAKIRNLKQLRQVRAAVQGAGLFVKRQVARYPSKRRLTRKSVYGSSFKSEKQRRWFFAALRKGEIAVPYRRGQDARSEALGRSWTVAAQNAGLTAIIGTNVSYARYQQDEEKQSLYAKAVGWVPVQKTMADPAVVDEVTGRISAAVARAVEEG
jgi:uncharacterized protein YbjQ (UPF0145 family)